MNALTHSEKYTICRKLALLALLGCNLLGCSGKSNQGTVTGKITFAGQPVTQGIITFSGPVDVAQGQLNEEGVYKLWQIGDGLALGEYRVTVLPLETFEEVPGQGVKRSLVGEESIPEKYRDRSSTPLRALLTGEKDTFDFEMQP